MKSTVLFLVLCFAVASYAQVEIAMIEKTDFGKTLLETIELNLQTGEPVQVILDYLNKLEADLEKKQKQADEAHKAFQTSCTNDINGYQADIAQNEKMIKQAQDNLAELRPKLVAAKKNKAKWEAKLDSLESQLASIIETRNKEAAEYKVKVAEHDRALVAVTEAKKLFSGLLSKKSVKAAFLQSKQSIFTQLTSNLRAAAQEMETAGYKAIFNLLAQVAEKAPIQADQSIVEKILNLCQKVIDNINDSAQKEKTAEDARIKSFKEQKSKLESDIVEAKGNIQRLTTEIETLSNAIKQNEAQLKEQTEDLSKNKAKLAARQAECEDERAKYVAARKKNTSERNTVSEAINIVNEKLVTLKAYIKTRVKNVA